FSRDWSSDVCSSDLIPFSRFPRSKHFMIRLFSALAATTILCGCVAQPTPIASAPATADTASQPQAAAHTPAGQPKYGTYGFDTEIGRASCRDSDCRL